MREGKGGGGGSEGSGFKSVPFASRALILGVSGGARGHVSLISSVVRAVYSAAARRSLPVWSRAERML